MDTHFEQTLAVAELPIAADFSLPCRSLLVAFGGIATGMGMPPFEFFRLASQFPSKKMFVRDLEQAWYQRGLVGISHDVPTTTNYLAQRISLSGADRTVLVGNSMGGYAAILFGTLLGVDAVHAFSPQTFMSPLLRLIYFDRRWREPMRRLRGISRDYFDLKHVLTEHPSSTTIHLHFAKHHRLDRIHAQRLRSFPNIHLHAYPSHKHNLIKSLRQTGVLQNILQQALVQPSSRAA